MLERNSCPNLNHGCANAPVRFCPMCGEVVNKQVPKRICGEDDHVAERRQRNKYCVYCGEQLIRQPGQ